MRFFIQSKLLYPPTPYNIFHAQIPAQVSKTEHIKLDNGKLSIIIMKPAGYHRNAEQHRNYSISI